MLFNSVLSHDNQKAMETQRYMSDNLKKKHSCLKAKATLKCFLYRKGVRMNSADEINKK